jgi:hypothetical protein
MTNRLRRNTERANKWLKETTLDGAFKARALRLVGQAENISGEKKYSRKPHLRDEKI